MDIFEADDNSTPLTAEEKNGLKLKWITLRSELNEAEARNIAQAQLWLSDKTSLTVEFLVDKEIGTYALNRIWHSEQIVEERQDGSIYVRFKTTQKHEIVRWILGQGHTVKVLGSVELIDEIKNEIDLMTSLYEKKEN